MQLAYAVLLLGVRLKPYTVSLLLVYDGKDSLYILDSISNLIRNISIKL